MLNIVVAWMAEARPLVEHFRLKPMSKKYGFRIFRNAEMNLVVTGQGRAACAAGCAWLQAVVAADAGQPWLNVGIAGHRQMAIGSVVLAEQVVDAATGKYWRLPFSVDDIPSAGLLTVPVPDTSYRRREVVEMEASGFVEVVLRFTDRENITCLKVISDNADNPTDAFEPAQATRLIEANLDALEQVIEKLEWQNA